MANCGIAVVCGEEAFITHSLLFIYFKNMQTRIFEELMMTLIWKKKILDLEGKKGLGLTGKVRCGFVSIMIML